MLKKNLIKSASLIKKHRIISSVIVIALLAIIYLIYSKSAAGKTETRYILSQVQRGTIMSTVSGTGQVSASNQVDIKSKASGDVTQIKVINGQAIKKNDILVQLNARDAYKAVRDAQTNLETARLSLEKLKAPADELSVLQAENSLSSAEDAKRKAEDNITKAYEDALNTISDAFLDFPTIIAGLYDIQFGNAIGASELTIGRSQDNNSALNNSLPIDERNTLKPFQDSASADYAAARTGYDSNFTDYKNISRSASPAEIEALLAETLNTARAMAQSAKSESNYIDTWVDLRGNNTWSIFSQVKTYQTNLSTYIGQTNSHLSALLALQATIKDNQQALLTASKSIQEKTISLANLQAGTNALDLRSAQITVDQRLNSLYDAQEQYANYAIRAPFDGVVASVTAKLGDTMPSGGAIATLITQQKIATLSVNEVDVATVKVGQKATLTFDAVSDLSISGEIIDVDIIGAASQGVVSYNIKIGFDTQDERIKPGMSVSATIITDIKQDILIVPNSAIKNQGNSNYVQIIAGAIDTSTLGITTEILPESVTIEVGVSDDNNSEIISGLIEGEFIVIKTTTATAGAKTSTQAPSIMQSIGAGGRTSGAVGGNMRFQGN